MEQSKQFNKYFLIPFQKRTLEEENLLHVVCIYDASSSMTNYWPWLAQFHNKCIPINNCFTITFDSKAYICGNNILSENIDKHGGGRTAIPEAFQLLEQHLNENKQLQYVTIIFISDGADNHLNTLQDRMKTLKGNQNYKCSMNFICLGVGQKYPHFLSMQLRQLYHNGDDTIPPLYLIEYASEKAFFNKFEGIKNYFTYSKLVKIEPSVCLFPWDDSKIDRVYEGQWVILQSQSDHLLNNIVIENLYQEITVQSVQDLFRNWVQNIQLLALKDNYKGIIKSFARTTLLAMEIQTEKLTQKLGVDVRRFTESGQKQLSENFYIRARDNYIYRYGQKINWYFDQLQDLLLGQKKEENEFEAAKKMNIGTINGEKQFTEMKNEFIQVYNIIEKKECKNKIGETIFQKDFLQGIPFLTNQFDLIEVFPLNGLALKCKRYQYTETQPWQFEIKSISDQEMLNQQIVDLQLWGTKKSFNSIIGPPIDYGNCYLPIFQKEDQNIIQLMNTKLMRFYISWIQTWNFDESYDESYLILVFSAMQAVMDEKDKNLQKQQMIRLVVSIEIYYQNDQDFHQYGSDLIKTVYQAESINYNKSLAHLTYQVLLNQSTLQNSQKLITNLALRYIHGLVKQYGLIYFLRPIIIDNEIQILTGYILQKEIGQLLQYYSCTDLQNGIKKHFIQYLENSNFQFKVFKDRIFEKPLELNMEFLTNFSNDFLNLKLDEQQLAAMICHVSCHEDFYDIPIATDIKFIQKTILQFIDIDNIQKIQGTVSIYQAVLEIYQSEFQKAHFDTLPISSHKAQEIAQKYGKTLRIAQNSQRRGEIEKHKNYYFYFKPDEQDQPPTDQMYEYNQRSHLFTNACLSPNCPYYQISVNQFDFQKHIGAWTNKAPPQFHKRLQEIQSFNKNISENDLYTRMKQTYGDGFPLQYGLNEAQTKIYISRIIQSINKI